MLFLCITTKQYKMQLLMKGITAAIGLTIIVIITTTALLYTYPTSKYGAQRNESYKELHVINWTRSDNISCHYVTEGDVLPSTEAMHPPPDSVFFHETSCRSGLNSRQACVVESVARIHPERNIYVFFNSPISERVLKTSCLAKLTLFKNVKLARLHTAEYAKGTALEMLLADRDNINKSDWRIEHTADMLRYVTMYKYGGVYLDTDMLLVKPLDSLGRNWAGRESDTRVSIGALAFTKDEVGHNLLASILHEIKVGYQPYSWTWNGPDALTRMLLRFCNCSIIPELSARTCYGFEVYKPEVYPLDYMYANDYYYPGSLPQRTKNTFFHHLWNHLTHHMQVEIGSPFEVLARKHCPTIRDTFRNNFGD